MSYEQSLCLVVESRSIGKRDGDQIPLQQQAGELGITSTCRFWASSLR